MSSIENQLIAMVCDMTVHGGANLPAPHKPLLVALVASRRAQRPAGPRLLEYNAVAPDLTRLLKLAGRSPRPSYPFVRMRTEPFWELAGDLELNDAGDVARLSELRTSDVRGGFGPEFDAVVTNPEAARRVINALSAHWFDPAFASVVVAQLVPGQGSSGDAH